MEDEIFKYLNSEMTDADILAFEEQMYADKNLKKQVTIMSLLKAAMKVQKIEDSIKRENRIRKIWIWGISVVASVLLIISISFAGYKVHNYNSNQADLCLRNMISLNAENSSRGSSPEAEALELYGNGNNDAALAILNGVIEQPDIYDLSDAYFIKGAILLQGDGFNEEAISCLEKSENKLASRLLDSLKFKFLY